MGVSDEEAYKLALSILVPMGEYFQVQDDVLDAFAPPEVLGKIGTDILVSSTFIDSKKKMDKPTNVLLFLLYIKGQQVFVAYQLGALPLLAFSTRDPRHVLRPEERRGRG